jgi:regulator of protease activity HflC (stomatin/prohibitin superfamily)
MGKFHRILEPGLNILLPVVDKVKYVQSLKEIAIDVPKQSAITSGKCKKKNMPENFNVQGHLNLLVFQ